MSQFGAYIDDSEYGEPDPITQRKKRRDDLLAFWQDHVGNAYDGLLTGDGWKFDPIAQTYTSDAGTTLRHADLHRLACTFVKSVQDQLRTDAQNVRHPGNPDGTVPPDAWAAQLRQQLDDEFFLLLLLACGGFDQAGPDLWPVLQGRPSTATEIGTGLADIDQRIANLLADIRADTAAAGQPGGVPVVAPPTAAPPAPAPATPSPAQPPSGVPTPPEPLPRPTPGETAPTGKTPFNVTPGQIVNRAGGYADQGFTVYEQGRQATVKKAFDGATDDDGRKLNVWCQNLLDPFADHCEPGPFTPGCPDLTAEGFVPIDPTIAAQFGLVPIPAPGLRTCMGNCKCSLEYILVPDGTTPDDLADAMESD